MKILLEVKIEVEVTNAEEALKVLEIENEDKKPALEVLDAELAKAQEKLTSEIAEACTEKNNADFKADASIKCYRI